jgi:hypothetical protein
MSLSKKPYPAFAALCIKIEDFAFSREHVNPSKPLLNRTRTTMKKLYTISLLAVALAAGACANKKNVDYTYETQAPYADERTVGEQQPVVTQDRATTQNSERMFEKTQRK